MLASDKPRFIPRLFNLRPVKSINQYYNKRRAELQSHIERRRTRADVYSASPLSARNVLTTTCTPPSLLFIDLLVADCIGTLFIGKNPLW